MSSQLRMNLFLRSTFSSTFEYGLVPHNLPSQYCRIRPGTAESPASVRSRTPQSPSGPVIGRPRMP
eukprot:1507492-Rhodomonas_salina.1